MTPAQTCQKVVDLISPHVGVGLNPIPHAASILLGDQFPQFQLKMPLISVWWSRLDLGKFGTGPRGPVDLEVLVRAYAASPKDDGTAQGVVDEMVGDLGGYGLIGVLGRPAAGMGFALQFVDARPMTESELAQVRARAGVEIRLLARTIATARA